MIDRLRDQIQERLDQLHSEADRLRKALTALDPRSSTGPPPKRPAASAASANRSVPASAAAKPTALAPKRTRAARAAKPAAGAASRTAPGATKAAVLAALAGGDAMTAGEVAAKAGLARATVSTTLSKLAKSGEVEKAERGYRVASATASSPAQ